MIKKVNLFENINKEISTCKGKEIKRHLYSSYNHNVDEFFPRITFAIKPTKNTKELFKMLLDNYNIENNSSQINYNGEAVKYWKEFDILNTMRFGCYKVSLNREKDMIEQLILNNSVIIKYIDDDLGCTVFFNEIFKDFFDKYFEL